VPFLLARFSTENQYGASEIQYQGSFQTNEKVPDQNWTSIGLVCAPGFGKDAEPETNTLEQEKIRVLIANSTRIWRDMLYDTIREEQDIEIVGDVSEENAIVPATERTNPDCLIVPLDESGAEMSICAQILARRPHIRIVAIGEGTDVVEIYWMSEEGDIRRTYTTASREAILRALHFSTC